MARVDRDTKSVRTLAAKFDGKAFVAPRRLVGDARGGVYFSDDTADGKAGCIYYVSALGTVSRTAALRGRVRGLALSADGKTLYAAHGNAAEVMAYTIESAGSLVKGSVLAKVPAREGKVGAAADLAVDDRGVVYVLNAGTQHLDVFGPEGGSLARARLDEMPVACALGGENARRSMS